MYRIEKTANLIKSLNGYRAKKLKAYDFITEVCNYFDYIKDEQLSSSDLEFLKYISNAAGIPHYYDLLEKFNHDNKLSDISLNTLSSLLYESSLYIDENIKVHKYQQEILNQFLTDKTNRYFLSATTSFGKTFLVYEIIRKLKYKNVALIFPTIALLSENYEKLISDSQYNYFSNFSIHTLSDVPMLGDQNLFIYTPERYLSFIDKHRNFSLDFVFIDEIYKIDNEYLIDSENKENERDIAYRIALHEILPKTSDILLVGPYIEFPEEKNNNINQSFNIFLKENRFKVIDFNKYEIVSKKIISLTNGLNKIAEELEITIKSTDKSNEKVCSIIASILYIQENALLYTSGPAKAEKTINNLLKLSSFQKNNHKSKRLQRFILHLEKNYNLRDKENNTWILIKALKNKIGIHHGHIPKYIQKEIVDLFNEGSLNVLISTTTITEGVNTSAKNLVVLSAYKGKKTLKSFDAKNIVGRAGRFLHHYSGRVLILSPEFEDILKSKGDVIKYKNYDEEARKDDIDLFITDNKFLNLHEKMRKLKILAELKNENIPNEIISMFKAMSYQDKLYIYKRIKKLNTLETKNIKLLIQYINSPKLNIHYDGLKTILYIIKPIITNPQLKRIVETETKIESGTYPIITYMLSAYINNGFLGCVKYQLEKRSKQIDEAIRITADVIFNQFKYQLVKYLGVFNIMYKYHQTTLNNTNIDEEHGIDKLLIKLEYNALTEKGRLASDYGAPQKIIEYYEKEENKNIRNNFDEFEKEKFEQISKILD
ncbi:MULTISPECIES: helicase-related protein [unclassified Gilliamella]|uniref:helicase-related protein n=1 Tax=unclassified Gilliamella TaxID=2685620 RepID=UPI00226A0800|nr:MULTISPECIES: helicase-related protein [unclassified Gilliamella]MCX8656384.1 DEAD/DEAH box helicase family protein [Gilliamella sp. B2894]MCX8665226.1 DEAD/DEAH box helicase family protein [Gilliamella sp. B2887]MCX8693678.1 DEAD/DEAH box helicase family protein [Gilliamella sp. B2881]MCX8696409.1 DEAD/DEAH box helicase family protein [Gilliamella sp. B2828]MCX8697702.1 DEAD/DEAH box helicase family protein [Gilliamella sp. B3000]